LVVKNPDSTVLNVLAVIEDMSILHDFCRGRYPVGMFYVDKDLWTDDGIKQAAGTGADFLVSVESAEPLISLCEKYGLAIISTSTIAPLWWGGNGDNAGGLASALPLRRFGDIGKAYPSSPAIWGDYLVDEPNSSDFKHINKIINRYSELFPGKIPFINLYPCYGSIPKNTEAEIAAQLGNATYAEHIDQYVREVDLPYISFDFYPFTGMNVLSKYLSNLDIVAKACRKSSKEMWVIIQTGAWKAEDMLSAHQLDWQVYLCLAYGADAIIHASYSKGWWEETTSCVNLKGDKNLTYDYVKEINSMLHSPLGTEILGYDHICTRLFGDITSSDERLGLKVLEQSENEPADDLPEINVISDKAVVAGFFRRDDSFAVMVVNSHNPFDDSITAKVRLEAPGRREVNIMGSGNVSGNLNASDKSIADLKLMSGQGVFVTFKQ